MLLRAFDGCRAFKYNGAMTEIPIPGGDLERRVLVALWELGGKVAARAVHERVNAAAEVQLAYTTIATILERLREKRLVRRRRAGRVVLYEATKARADVERAHAAATLKGLLGDEPKPAIALLVDAVADLDPELVDELARVVKKRRGSRHGS